MAWTDREGPGTWHRRGALGGLLGSALVAVGLVRLPLGWGAAAKKAPKQKKDKHKHKHQHQGLGSGQKQPARVLLVNGSASGASLRIEYGTFEPLRSSTALMCSGIGLFNLTGADPHRQLDLPNSSILFLGGEPLLDPSDDAIWLGLHGRYGRGRRDVDGSCKKGGPPSSPPRR